MLRQDTLVHGNKAPLLAHLRSIWEMPESLQQRLADKNAQLHSIWEGGWEPEALLQVGGSAVDSGTRCGDSGVSGFFFGAAREIKWGE